MKTEITSLLIISKFEQHDMLGATAIAVVMLVASFTILMSINGLQWYIAKRFRG
jgi:sulfate transport system permease protein